MASPNAASGAAALMANLQQSRSTTGDFTITCEGRLIKAHSVILAHGSNYFKSAMNFDRTAIDIKECPPALLFAAVDFLYGVEVPAELEDLQGLLSLANMLLLEGLKEVVGRRLGEQVTAENCIEMSQMAETYRSDSLATACSKIIVKEGEEGVDWRAIEELPRVTAAVARIATQVLWNTKKSTVKELMWSCELCSKRVSTPWLLSQHMTVSHLADEVRRRYWHLAQDTCQLCDKPLPDMPGRSKYVLLHLGATHGKAAELMREEGLQAVDERFLGSNVEEQVVE